MKVILTDTFGKSLQKLANSHNVFRKEYWKKRWWEFKWAIKNLRQYFKVVVKMKDYDYRYILQMMQFQLGLLRLRIDHGYEIEETRIPKTNKILRLINVIGNILEDNYKERSGYDPNALKMIFKETGEEIEIDFEKRKGYEDYDMKSVMNATKNLRELEWVEMLELLGNARSWWE